MGIAVLVLTFFLALLSLTYELLIAQTMALLAANTVVWYGLTVGIFIGAMGLGALWSERFTPIKRPLAMLAALELFLGVIGGGSAIVLHLAHTGALLFPGLWATLIFFVAAFLCAAAIGILTGAELPILMELAEQKKPLFSSAQILGADYFGSLAAGIIFPVVLLPYLSVLQIGLLAGALSAAVAFVLLWVEQDPRGQAVAFGAAGVVLLLGVACLQAPLMETFFAEKYYFASLGEGSWKDLFSASSQGGKVERYRSPYQQIDIVEFPGAKDETVRELIRAYQHPPARADKGLLGWALFLNGEFQFAADVEDIYHETFAHVPLAATGVVPRHVLILGAGDGFLAREVLKYPQVESVTLVELDARMVRLFGDDPKLSALGAGAFKDKRLRTVIGDAYDFVRRDKGHYDAIYLDFPAPVDYDLAKLFSREFYRFVRARLVPGGVVALDAPGTFPGEDFMLEGNSSVWPAYVGTLKAAGFQRVTPYFSRLEDDNPAALQVMAKMYEGVDHLTRTDTDETTGKENTVLIQGAEEVQREFLRNHVHELTAGFVFATAEPAGEARTLSLPAIPLEILDERRLNLSLTVGRTFQEESGAFNSIFRPVVPRTGAWWRVRSPY